MELDIGLKFTRASDEFESEFQITKDRSGSLFLSRETETMFLLTAHLKGYNRRNIKIDINEDGTLITISGEKQVQETVVRGWRVYKNDREIKGFKKVFRIPGGVILDKIHAKFNDDESTLTVLMPKKVKGIQGTGIQEVQVNEELVKDESKNLQVVEETTQRTETSRRDIYYNLEPVKEEDVAKSDLEDSYAEVSQGVHDLKDGDKVHKNNLINQTVIDASGNSPDLDPHLKPQMPKEELQNQKPDDCIQESTEPKHDLKAENHTPFEKEEQEGGSIVKSPEEDRNAELAREEEAESKPEDKGFKICTPILAGSALLLSFVVFVIHIMRSKGQNSKRRE